MDADLRPVAAHGLRAQALLAHQTRDAAATDAYPLGLQSIMDARTAVALAMAREVVRICRRSVRSCAACALSCRARQA